MHTAEIYLIFIYSDMKNNHENYNLIKITFSAHIIKISLLKQPLKHQHRNRYS